MASRWQSQFASAAFLLLLSPAALHAQGCAMCYQNAASSGAKLIAALRHGILLLMFPPLLIFSRNHRPRLQPPRYAFAEYPEADVSANPDAQTEENHEVDIPLYD
jgi:hypothetical protein